MNPAINTGDMWHCSSLDQLQITEVFATVHGLRKQSDEEGGGMKFSLPFFNRKVEPNTFSLIYSNNECLQFKVKKVNNPTKCSLHQFLNSPDQHYPIYQSILSREWQDRRML